ncbi:S8/S53 family peptidase [Nonomuraea sp. PA05]|uniref:S8/S53 family peptidase n=1 Tax=Nonomuraea sp. PA05 TaxID=2604466 RepID=UPI001652A6BA|nr:S8/S53 family peptidase [Nonomuraea sp. PA05]
MADDKVVRRRIEAFFSDQIVIDPKDVRQVGQELDALKIKMVPLQSSLRLGLHLYQLGDLADGVRLLDHGLVERVKRAAVGTYMEGEEPSALDLALFHLREKSAAEHAGYRPVVAKNRVYENIEGSPYSGGSVGDPRPAPAFALPARSHSTRRRPRIGILDTPMHAHPRFAGRYVTDSDDALLEERQDRVSFSGHAIFVASVAAQQAPDAEFVIYPVLNPDRLTTSSWRLATTMAGAMDDDLDMMIMALGGATADGREPLALARACERTSGVVKVAALGNNGRNEAGAPPDVQVSELPPNIPMWPAASSTVIAVGARNAHDVFPAYFSPTQAQAPWVDCTAPGQNLRGLFLSGHVWMAELNVLEGVVERTDRSDYFPSPGYATWSGSSFSAAYAGGAMAQRAYTQGISVQEVADRLFREEPGSTPTTYDHAPSAGIDGIDVIRFQ